MPIQILHPDKRSSKKKGDKFGGMIHGRKSKSIGTKVVDQDGEIEKLGDIVCVEITKGRRKVYRQNCNVAGESVDGLWAQEEEVGTCQHAVNLSH